ncbi:MAG: polymerase subunit gamma/tau, partial [Aeromicrobium sp.]|nr:polymerase subunit gamma/tau [Aeromicrobium sp.]
AADIVNAALMEFRGATAPRLLLELMCARILVPGSDNSTQGFQARLDRVERRLSMDAGATPAAPPESQAPAAPPQIPTPPAQAAEPPTPEPVAEVQAPSSAVSAPTPTPPSSPPTPIAEPVEVAPAPVAPPVAERPAPLAAPASSAPAPIAEPTPAPAGHLTIADVRRLWPEILDKIRDLRRFAWVMLSQNAQVTGLDGSTLTIALVNAGARDSFLSSGSDEYVKKALHEVLGVTWRIEAIVDPSARPGAHLEHDDPAPVRSTPPTPASPPVTVPDSVRQALRDPGTPQTREDPDASADRNDPVIESEELDPELLLSRELGAEVIDETRTD